jgi:GntR family transcriptional regulator
MHTPLTISQADRRPMYLQLMEQIRHLVAVGTWRAGDEIPSIRNLAADLRISVITIKRAYLELESEGVIVTRQGRGTFVADNPRLGPDLTRQELQSHLHAAVRLARRLGLGADEVADRLHDAFQQGADDDADLDRIPDTRLT